MAICSSQWFKSPIMRHADCQRTFKQGHDAWKRENQMCRFIILFINHLLRWFEMLLDHSPRAGCALWYYSLLGDAGTAGERRGSTLSQECEGIMRSTHPLT